MSGQNVITTTLDDIPLLTRILGARLRGGSIIALVGPLGSGKTTFVKALGKHLGVRQRITSPTFTLMRDFLVARNGRQSLKLLHVDLYRTKNFQEIKTLGVEEQWGKKNTITCIEWADKIKHYLPKKTVWIYFTSIP